MDWLQSHACTSSLFLLGLVLRSRNDLRHFNLLEIGKIIIIIEREIRNRKLTDFGKRKQWNNSPFFLALPLLLQELIYNLLVIAIWTPHSTCREAPQCDRSRFFFLFFFVTVDRTTNWVQTPSLPYESSFVCPRCVNFWDDPLARQWWLHFRLSLCLYLSLSPKVPHAQYRKRFGASYNRYIGLEHLTVFFGLTRNFGMPRVSFDASAIRKNSRTGFLCSIIQSGWAIGLSKQSGALRKLFSFPKMYGRGGGGGGSMPGCFHVEKFEPKMISHLENSKKFYSKWGKRWI